MKDIVHKKQNAPAPKIGLALGSGSARGWAHIGVIKALTEAGIHVDYVAGTSVGAVVGAVYASGRIDSFKDVVLQLDWKKIASFLDVVFPKSGLIDGNRIAEFIRSHVGEKNIEDLSLPFCAVSTDLATGNEVVFQDGDIIEAVRASISVPGVFTPVRKSGAILVDGGLVNPVPVSVVREMGADLVIAVDLNHDIIDKKGLKKASITNSSALAHNPGTMQGLTKGSKILDALNNRLETLDLAALTHIRQWMARDPMPNIFEVLMTSINIMETQITATRLKADPPEALIQPHLGHIRFLEFNRAEEAIVAGYEETKRIKTCLSEKLA
ncbi:MAG: patatin-like phospholipase family protein [Deltaproteobacteria bacterium]|nr:patatin-like phospholipase family protein [Deltaproteobacteria bacterium]MBW2106303.1 patatin-like phospholipase family protein [Deltaproteobacteria bacterium]